MKESILMKKSAMLAAGIVSFCHSYSQSGNYILSNQLLRSGTGIGANVAEAGAAQTRKDFITKLAIASKEARETMYWLKLIQAGESASSSCDALIADTEEIIRLLTASVKTAQRNKRSSNTSPRTKH
jgi:four helix bundle protein